MSVGGEGQAEGTAWRAALAAGVLVATGGALARTVDATGWLTADGLRDAVPVTRSHRARPWSPRP